MRISGGHLVQRLHLASLPLRRSGCGGKGQGDGVHWQTKTERRGEGGEEGEGGEVRRERKRERERGVGGRRAPREVTSSILSLLSGWLAASLFFPTNLFTTFFSFGGSEPSCCPSMVQPEAPLYPLLPFSRFLGWCLFFN